MPLLYHVPPLQPQTNASGLRMADFKYEKYTHTINHFFGQKEDIKKNNILHTLMENVII